MAAPPSASAESGVRNPQQGMSPTQALEGELLGPNYGQEMPAQLRDEERRLQTETQLPNGVGPSLATPGNAEGSQDAEHGRQERAEDRANSRGVRIMTEPAQEHADHDPPISWGTGHAASVHELAAPERDVTLYDESGTALFDRFSPSPLPGQSPVVGHAGGSSRSTWFGRLGDYIQRRVEVTAWSSPPNAGGNPGTAWPRPEGAAELPRLPVPVAAQPARHADSASSGSVGFSAEMVQAEVARQLEHAVGDIMDRLQAERQRTMEATSEAQRLRQQLEWHEAQMKQRTVHTRGLPTDAEMRMMEVREFNLEFPQINPYLVLVVKGNRAMLEYLNPTAVIMSSRLQGDRPETVKPGINELPFLPEYQPQTGSIDLLNWITHIGPIMQDLSDTSATWWTTIMKDVSTWYHQYSSAAPLARLQLRPQASPELTRPEWARVERRATAMMLSAVPRGVRDEVIAHGQVTSLVLLCKLYAMYQPGNLQEKALVLKMLEMPDECSSAQEAMEGLRKWNLWRRRAMSIGIAEPDASVLLKGLDRITGPIVRANHELSFRVSLIRSTLQVDVSPSSGSVTTFLQHLQAEMEQQARLGAARPSGDVSTSMRALTAGADSGTPSTPSAAAPTTGTPAPSTPRASGNVCKFFMGDRGCRRGNSCKFPHTWNAMDKATRAKKCLCCGAVGHKARECKAPGGGAFSPKGAPKGSTVGASDTGATTSAAATSESPTRRVNFEPGDVQVKVMKVIEEVRHMKMFQPLVAALECWKDHGFYGLPKPRGALLDSGSTHVLRQPKDQQEWDRAKQVNVQLAGDAVAAMKQTVSGSLLSAEELAQVIVPLGKVISTLGYKLDWTADHCILHGEDNEQLVLDVKNGCPEVSHAVAQQLIQRLERHQLPELESNTQLSVKALRKLKMSWWSCLEEYVKTGNVLEARTAVEKATFINYKDVVKNEMITKLPRPGIWDLMKSLKVNRRARKRLLRAESWALRWDPPTVERFKDPLKHLAFIGGVVYVNMNSMLVENEFGDVWKVIQWAALQGKISAIVSRDCLPRHLDQLAAGPHRSKVHFLHALACAGKQRSDGTSVKFYVEDMDRINYNRQRATENYEDLWPAWTECQDTKEYLDEMGYGRSPDGKFFRYFVIGALRIPEVDGGGGHAEVRGHPIPGEHGDQEEEDRLSEEEAGEADGGDDGAGVDPAEVADEERKWKELLSTFKEPIKTSTLYFAVPVNNKKAATMLPAVQRIVMDIKALGYPVTRLHTDRGGEFRGNVVRKWALAQGMWPTTTSGSDSAANGVAESGVRFLKRRARILLDSAGVGKEHWPTAVQYAAAQQRADVLGSLPSMPVAYGTKVYVKTKRYKTGAVEDFGPHWTVGRYAGPSTDIRGGHVILKATGTFIQTTHVRVARDPPPLDEVAPTVIVEPEDPAGDLSDEPPLPPPVRPPPRRMSQGPLRVQDCLEDEEEAALKYLKFDEIQYVERIAEEMLRESRLEDHDGQGLVMGAFVHGGSFGVTRYGRDLPWVTKFFNAYMKKKLTKNWPHLNYAWTTLVIQAAKEVPKHKDSHNERDTYNYVLELKAPASGGLWVQDLDCQRRVVGGSDPQDYQYQTADDEVHDGCLVNVQEIPAVFDPLVPHAYVPHDGVKWFLSAYTPQGSSKLSMKDKEYLKSAGFPMDGSESHGGDPDGVLETRPALNAVSFPCEGAWSRARVPEDDVEAATVGDCEATFCEWAMYTDAVGEGDERGLDAPSGVRRLCKVCGSDDPGDELEALTTLANVLDGDAMFGEAAEDLSTNVEFWSSLGLYDNPRLAKLEPEYVENIEKIIQEAKDSRTPLRHTYNVSPQEAKQVIHKWKPAIEKELGVVEKGFLRVDAKDIAILKRKYVVQELPSKLVYTVKPPNAANDDTSEEFYCRRKARIVCCGNFAAEDQSELFAGGAAAESLRCSLVYALKRVWRAAIVDIAGAFMLTPLAHEEGGVVYIIRPPAALIQLGLAKESERWMLTHGMYGLRQSPKLWASFRDTSMSDMSVEAEGKQWMMLKGRAEPNLWLVYEVGAALTKEPAALVLVYVDDILLSGPLWLVTALAKMIGQKWKTSPLDLLTPDHDVRFLGCELSTNEDMDAIYVHQLPYIEEILRLHEVTSEEQSHIQAPREMVTFEAFEGEEAGTPDEVRQAQRLCGELLWLAQRSRPDVSFVVSAMGSLLTRAAPRCLRVGRRLLAYLQRTKNLALTLKPVGSEFVAFSDSSFAPSGSRSHTGIVLTWMNSPISWRACKQPFTCLSTAECELVAAIEALTMAKSIEVVLRQLDSGLGKIILGIDNQAAISIATPTTNSSWRTRHLRVRASYIHEQIEDGQVIVRYVPGRDQWADLLTKSFPRQRLGELTMLWGFVDTAAEVMKTAAVRTMLLCHLVQTARAQRKDPLPLDSSMELYVIVLMVGIALIALWEALWWLWDKCCSSPTSSRSAIRLRGIQEAVQRELAAQMAQRESIPATPPLATEPTSTPAPVTPRRTRGASSSTTPSRIPATVLGSPGPRRVRMVDSATQTVMDDNYVPIVEYLDRDVPVPVPHPGPVLVSPNGDHFHTVPNCWGLRNVARPRRLMLCNLCQNNGGRSLY
ncbi:GIP [Symbiodinium sp. CCMP2592]|nr:GIP [Symbiodinium sp. CCMP2592]